MSSNFIIINGKHPDLDYQELENSFNQTIAKNCLESKVFVINNLPVAISSEIDIDVILIITVLNAQGNYYIIKDKDGKHVYLKNQIIPITFIKGWQQSIITLENKKLIVDDTLELIYSSEIDTIRYGLRNYLSNHCQVKGYLYVNPLIYIQNEQNIYIDNYIVSNSLNFNILLDYFKQSTLAIFISNLIWSEPTTYYNIENTVKRIVEQASIDSETGFLTKKKLDRISKKLSSTKAVFDDLGKQMVIVSGKAGTGKSSELLLLAMKCITENVNSIYLTYNRLLVYDISKIIKDYKNSVIDRNDSNEQEIRLGICTVDTLHSFFYRLSKSLGVLHVLSEDRIMEVLGLLKIRLNNVFTLIKPYYSSTSCTLAHLKIIVENDLTIDIPTKQEGIDFINYVLKKRLRDSLNLTESIHAFFKYKEKLLANIELQEIFIRDYYGVLENTLLQIQSPESFYQKHDIGNKYNLLAMEFGLNQELEPNEDLVLTQDNFEKVSNRRIKAKQRKKSIFIDEAQDCHRLEKDILIAIFGSEKLVIANGGKEQLIRHSEVCNWEASQGKKIQFKKVNTYNKSFRMKKASVDLCNYIAKQYMIDLNLIPTDSEDIGEVIIDFRKLSSPDNIENVFSELEAKGTIYGCKAYESLLVLIDSHSQVAKSGSQNMMESTQKAKINEYGSIQVTHHSKENKWLFLDHFKSKTDGNFVFWDGTITDKKTLSIPTSLESRLIYYESCRGLESWSVACFALDGFFEQRKSNVEAEKFLLDDIFLSADLEQRRRKYAATWILMALTRVIDTLYIQIEDPNSEIAQLLLDYVDLNKNNSNIRVLTD